MEEIYKDSVFGNLDFFIFVMYYEKKETEVDGDIY